MYVYIYLYGSPPKIYVFYLFSAISTAYHIYICIQYGVCSSDCDLLSDRRRNYPVHSSMSASSAEARPASTALIAESLECVRPSSGNPQSGPNEDFDGSAPFTPKDAAHGRWQIHSCHWESRAGQPLSKQLQLHNQPISFPESGRMRWLRWSWTGAWHRLWQCMAL